VQWDVAFTTTLKYKLSPASDDPIANEQQLGRGRQIAAGARAAASVVL